jgi:lipopolysaccharide transport system permease protein
MNNGPSSVITAPERDEARRTLTSPPNCRLSPSNETRWTLVIRPKTGWFDLRLSELWRYRDLIMMYVRRDFVSKYEQTILGPLWFIIQPIITTITFTVIFGNIARLSTDGLPKVLFYLSGITPWTYFAECLNLTSNTFVSHAHTFSKVYFPRLVLPLSFVISNLLRLAIQIAIFLVFYGYFFVKGARVHPTAALLLLPVLIILMAAFALGCGVVVSAMTTRYRDLRNLVQFGLQLLMYTTPVIFPLSKIPPQYRWLILANPMTPVIETFRYAFLGVGSFSWANLALSAVFISIILFVGVLIFRRVEKSASDTV